MERLTMSGSNALTIPLTLMLGLSLSAIPAARSTDVVPVFSYYMESSYQTTSENTIAKGFCNPNGDPRNEALGLFGVQENFSPEEQITYRAMLKQNSKNVGINIFDLI